MKILQNIIETPSKNPQKKDIIPVFDFNNEIVNNGTMSHTLYDFYPLSERSAVVGSLISNRERIDAFYYSRIIRGRKEHSPSGVLLKLRVFSKAAGYMDQGRSLGMAGRDFCFSGGVVL